MSKQARKKERRMREYKSEMTRLITSGVPHSEAQKQAKTYVKKRFAKRVKHDVTT